MDTLVPIVRPSCVVSPLQIPETDVHVFSKNKPLQISAELCRTNIERSGPLSVRLRVHNPSKVPLASISLCLKTQIDHVQPRKSTNLGNSFRDRVVSALLPLGGGVVEWSQRDHLPVESELYLYADCNAPHGDSEHEVQFELPPGLPATQSTIFFCIKNRVQIGARYSWNPFWRWSNEWHRC